MNDLNIVVLQTEPRLKQITQCIIDIMNQKCSMAIKLYVEDQTDCVILIVDSLKYFFSEQQAFIKVAIGMNKPLVIVNVCRYPHEKDFNIDGIFGVVHVLESEITTQIDLVGKNILTVLTTLVPKTEESINIKLDPAVIQYLERHFEADRKGMIELIEERVMKVFKDAAIKTADRLQKREESSTDSQPDLSLYFQRMVDWCKSQELNLTPIDYESLVKNDKFIQNLLPLLDQPPIEFMKAYSSYFLSSNKQFREGRLDVVTRVHFPTLRALINSKDLWKFQGHLWYVGFANCFRDHGFRF